MKRVACAVLAVLLAAPCVATAATEAAQNEARRAWTAYADDLLARLRAGPSPRDHALAATEEGFFAIVALEPKARTATPDRGTAMRDAAAAAPGDPLLQWLWASSAWLEPWARETEDANDDAASGCTAASPCPDRLLALARLDPGNVAAWLPAFDAAWNAKRPDEAERVLAQMSGARRYDDLRLVEIRALREIFERAPPPGFVRGLIGAEPEKRLPFALAMTAAGGSPTPRMFLDLMGACSRRRHPDAGAAHFQSCARVARAVLASSTSSEGISLGIGLLAVTGEASDADRERARQLRWLQLSVDDWSMGRPPAATLGASADAAAFAVQIPNTDPDSEAWFDARVATRDFAEAATRVLSAAKRPLAPPADWERATDPLDQRRNPYAY